MKKHGNPQPSHSSERTVPWIPTLGGWKQSWIYIVWKISKMEWPTLEEFQSKHKPSQLSSVPDGGARLLTHPENQTFQIFVSNNNFYVQLIYFEDWWSTGRSDSSRPKIQPGRLSCDGECELRPELHGGIKRRCHQDFYIHIWFFCIPIPKSTQIRNVRLDFDDFAGK